tara:strand:+ start:2516 stop:2881 length:366 start_codon:yes stop_codon:yes gene_type:complete
MKVTIHIERKADFETIEHEMEPAEFALLQSVAAHDTGINTYQGGEGCEIDFRGTTLAIHRTRLDMVEEFNQLVLKGVIFAAMTYSERTGAEDDKRYIEGRTEVLKRREAQEREDRHHLKVV